MRKSLEIGSVALPDDVTAVVLFDGECVLCNRAVGLLLRLDKGLRIKIASQNSTVGQRLMSAAAMGSSEAASMVVLSRRGIHTESDAVVEIATILGMPYSLLKVFRILPSTVRDAVYAWIARNRYRWFGRTTECGLISREHQDRFLGEML
jgi:predicted DCC family thiol-disulfide oxidoreductase YuxK